MQRALVLFCCIFRAWNVLWRYCVVFVVHGTRSVIIVLYFLSPNRSVARVCNTLWIYDCNYCVIFSECGGPAHGTRSSVIVLYFPHLNALWSYYVIFSVCGWPARATRSGVMTLYFRLWMSRACNTLWNYCVRFSACRGTARGTCSGVIVLYFRSGVIVLYFMRVERALALLCHIF